jgi:phosphoglycolate phosphatase-like HAD superfamily hydrolase
MATVQNVIFDLGGVLLDWNPGCLADLIAAITVGTL